MKSMKKLMLGVVPAVMTLVMPVTAMAQTYTYTTTTADDTGAAAAFLGFTSLCYFGLCGTGLIIDIVIAYWIHKDAKSRNNENAVLWAVLGFFFNWIGLLVYLLTQRKDNVAANTQAAEPAMESAAPAPEPVAETATTMESDEESK